MHMNLGMITITHDGKLTKGKSGAVKSELVREYVKRNSNIQVVGKEIILGSWFDGKEYKINDSNIKKFLANLIKYAILRDEFRNLQ